MRKKRIKGFTKEDFFLEETWVMLRLAKPQTCLNCRAFLERNCIVLPSVKDYIDKYFFGRLRSQDIFSLGCQCKTWR